MILKVTQQMPVSREGFSSPPFVDDFGNEWRELLTAGKPHCFTEQETFDGQWLTPYNEDGSENPNYWVAPIAIMSMQRVCDGLIGGILFRRCVPVPLFLLEDPQMRDVA